MKNMELGETIKLKNVILKCVEEHPNYSCDGCFFDKFNTCAVCDELVEELVGSCYDSEREDKMSVRFIKVEEEVNV